MGGSLSAYFGKFVVNGRTRNDLLEETLNSRLQWRLLSNTVYLKSASKILPEAIKTRKKTKRVRYS